MPPAPVLEEIRALEEALHDPQIRRSRQAVDALLAPDFREFGASGRAYDRESTIELLAGESDGEDGSLRSFNYTLAPIAPGAALLTYETERVHPDGSRRRALRSSIWTHDGQRWRMLFHQGTVKP